MVTQLHNTPTYSEWEIREPRRAGFDDVYVVALTPTGWTGYVLNCSDRAGECDLPHAKVLQLAIKYNL